MEQIMNCPRERCDGTIGLIRVIRRRSCVTNLETETYLVGCDECTLKQWTEMDARVMSDQEVYRLARPEEAGYEHS